MVVGPALQAMRSLVKVELQQVPEHDSPDSGGEALEDRELPMRPAHAPDAHRIAKDDQPADADDWSDGGGVDEQTDESRGKLVGRALDRLAILATGTAEERLAILAADSAQQLGKWPTVAAATALGVMKQPDPDCDKISLKCVHEC